MDSFVAHSCLPALLERPIVAVILRAQRCTALMR
jgi:hypothetical protein